MAKLDLAATMDALAGAVPVTLTTRTYGWPVDSVAPPAVVVGYPTTLDFDATFGRGSDHAIFPVWFVVGKVADKATRDTVSSSVSGTREIKEGIEGDSTLLSVIQTARVMTADIETVTIGAVDYIAIRYDVEVYS